MYICICICIYIYMDGWSLNGLTYLGPDLNSSSIDAASRTILISCFSRYLLSEHFAELARDRAAERDPTFHRMKAATV